MNCEMLINEFVIEKQCEFKGRTYKVRDNGSVMRIPIKNCKPKGLDNQWSFGRKNKRTGYMMYANVRVHQIVAGDCDEAVEKLLAGTLEHGKGAKCSHHSGEHKCGHHKGEHKCGHHKGEHSGEHKCKHHK